MRACIRITFLSLTFLPLIAFPAHSQTSPAQIPATSGVTEQTTPTPIRTTTRMVQLSVTVRDKKGQPVTGLKKEDFALLDGGQPQDIAVFSAETPAPTAPVRKLPPNIFTNRHEALGEPPGSNTIILFDALDTAPSDQSFAREQVLKFLRTIQPQDHFAIYVLANDIQILHEFTQDDAALMKAIQEYKIEQQLPIVPFTNALDFAGSPGAPMPFASQNAPNESAVEQQDEMETEYAEYRLYPLVVGFMAIANHVAAIPGRKNLIWISGGIRMKLGHLPTQVNLAKFGYHAGGPKSAETGYDLFRAAAESLNLANVVLYGVDVHTLQTGSSMDPSRRSVSGTSSSINANSMTRVQSAQGSLSAQQDTRETFRMLADETGGTAFYGNNDITEGMSRAFDDGRYAYTIGYYPNHGTWDGRFRKIQIKLKSADAQPRHRDGYYATTEGGLNPTEVDKLLHQAAISPLDSTALGMMVSLRHMQPLAKRELEFQVGVNVAQLLLDHSGDHWKGALDLMFVQRNAHADVIAAEKKPLGLDFSDAQYQGLLKDGAIFERHLEILPDAEDVRVIVRDAGSNVIGSVTVPIKSFLPAATGSTAIQAKPN